MSWRMVRLMPRLQQVLHASAVYFQSSLGLLSCVATASRIEASFVAESAERIPCR